MPCQVKSCLLVHSIYWAPWRKHAYSNILKISPPKTENVQIKNSNIFHISAQNIDCGYSLEPPRRGGSDCGYSLEPPRRGGSNEYPHSMFLSRNKKIMYTPVNPSFTVQKWGLRGSKLYRHVFVIGITFPTRLHVRLAKTQADQSSLPARRPFGSSTIHRMPCEDSDQTARMRMLIWVIARRTCNFVGDAEHRPECN